MSSFYLLDSSNNAYQVMVSTGGVVSVTATSSPPRIDLVLIDSPNYTWQLTISGGSVLPVQTVWNALAPAFALLQDSANNPWAFTVSDAGALTVAAYTPAAAPPALTMALTPGFCAPLDCALQDTQYVSDDTLVKLNHSIKFAAIRKEVFNMGYYHDGDSIPTPVSPVDSYAYTVDECMFIPLLGSACPVTGGFVEGQGAFPLLASQPSEPICMPYQNWIDLEANQHEEEYNQKGEQGAGAALVMCVATRVSTQPPQVQQLAVGDLVTIQGAAAGTSEGNNFNGTFAITKVTNQQIFSYAITPIVTHPPHDDRSGGGAIYFGDPTLTAAIVPATSGQFCGLYMDVSGNVTVRLVQPPAVAPGAAPGEIPATVPANPVTFQGGSAGNANSQPLPAVTRPRAT